MAILIKKNNTHIDWALLFQTDCQRKGSHLVKIEDASENKWLQQVMIGEFIDELSLFSLIAYLAKYFILL